MAARSDTAVDARLAGLERILSAYRPLAGIFDEMMDADGRVRPHWRPFLTMLASLGGEEINRRFAVADRYLRDSGVFYRVYEDPAGAERPWPLSHMPLIINPAEWAELKSGLIQRAELLELVLADAYGPATIVRDGLVPAVLIAGNPEFLRPLVGVAPPGGAHLRFYAVDVGRGADGRWWVLGDRTQAPSGAGFVLENRLALARAIPDVYRAIRVERLAPFFQAFQSELSSFNRQDDSRVCLLTPGPMNEILLRACLSGALSRASAGRRRGPDRARRRRLHPHRLGPEARRGSAAPPRCRFLRSVGAQCALASRRRRPGADGARRQGRHRQFARGRTCRGALDAGLPAGAGAGPHRRRSSPSPTSRPGGSVTRTRATRWSASSTRW